VAETKVFDVVANGCKLEFDGRSLRHDTSNYAALKAISTVSPPDAPPSGNA
jgi:hypothetical protein